MPAAQPAGIVVTGIDYASSGCAGQLAKSGVATRSASSIGAWHTWQVRYVPTRRRSSTRSTSLRVLSIWVTDSLLNSDIVTTILRPCSRLFERFASPKLELWRCQSRLGLRVPCSRPSPGTCRAGQLAPKRVASVSAVRNIVGVTPTFTGVSVVASTSMPRRLLGT
jgi:hypothetical protein